MDEDDRRKALMERGREASRFVASLRAGRRPEPRRFPLKHECIPDDQWLTDPTHAAMLGYWRYMRDMEFRVMEEARRQIAESRPHWRRAFMEIVEFHLSHQDDPMLVGLLKNELRKVRRALGLNKPPSADTVRKQTRLRVRRHRERKRREP